jgi:1-deoxy-D-xylulose-5-phosphate reductoisomerase
MIETIDGEIYAQLGVADMKFPIQNALTYPDILPNSFGKLKLYEISSLTFEKPDMDKFPLLRLAYDAGRIGNSMPVVLNASNEIAVNSFLMEKISYIDIYKYVSETIEKHNIINNPTYEEIIEIDKWARKYTINNIEKN